MWNSRNLVKIILILMTLCNISTALAAQDVRTGLFKEADEALKEAKETQADILAPKNFNKAMEFYNKAETDLKKGKKLEDIRKNLRASVGFLQLATKATALANVTFATVMKARTDALSADVLNYATATWNRVGKR
jgi:hypothetical protein